MSQCNWTPFENMTQSVRQLVHVLAPTTCWEWSVHQRQWISQRLTIVRCGSVWRTFWEQIYQSVPGPFRMPPRCRLHWVGLVSGRPRVSVVLLIGPVGQIASPWSTLGTLLSLLCFFIIWKELLSPLAWVRQGRLLTNWWGLGLNFILARHPQGTKWKNSSGDVVLVGNTRPVHAERHHRDSQTLLRSQGGPGSGLAFSTSPMCRITRLGSHHFRPLPLTVRSCRCGRPLDALGHHRAACARAGVLVRRGFALESVVARICREAGGRVSANVLLRDLDLHAPIAADGRRLEVAVDGMPLFGGAQLAVDTTLVSALHCDGTARRGAAHNEGVAISMAQRRKERRYPELVGRRARSRLVVLAVEVGGRWSPTTQHFISALARTRARCEGLLLRRRAEQAWRLRWGAWSSQVLLEPTETLPPHMRSSETSRLRGWRFEAMTRS